jgi:hypothetical protein
MSREYWILEAFRLPVDCGTDLEEAESGRRAP